MLLYIVLPCIFAAIYAMVALDELKHAVVILCLCVLFTSLLLSLLFVEDSNPVTKTEEMKRNVYKVAYICIVLNEFICHRMVLSVQVFETEGVEVTFRRLIDRLKAHSTNDGVDPDLILSYLKLRVFKDKKGEIASAAVRMGVIELSLNYLNSTTAHLFHPKVRTMMLKCTPCATY